MPSQSEIQESITNRIIEGLQNGIVPWQKPWKNDPNCGPATNVVSKRTYNGINPLLLDLASQIHGFTSKYWATFDQWKNLGGKVKKRPDHMKSGQWGTNVIFFRQVKRSQKDDSGEETNSSFPLMRSYTLFNLDQVEGESLDKLRPGSTPTVDTIPSFEEADRVIEATGADIRYGGNSAYYTMPNPINGGDIITMPERQLFEDQHELYATIFHELVHWSEHRLNWEGSYALGELIAEIGSCYLCNHTNVPASDNLQNHTVYVSNWLKELQNDRKFIFKAAAQASRATEFILSFSRSIAEDSVELEQVEA